MSSNELISPEIILLEKLEEVDRALPPALWQQMRSDVDMVDSLERADSTMLPAVRRRKRMFLRDFVDKAVSLPLKIIPDVPPETAGQLYRLHLFCCQRAMHCPEVRHNPFRLGFEALREMKTALLGMMISYRLIDPSCPYSWSHSFFESNIITDKEADGRTVVIFRGIPPHIIPLAITEEMVTDWLIYRAYDNNGIRTLMDYKNNLLTLPDYQRGGAPENEFSRFERKMQEQRNREEKHKNQELDLEFRKTLVKSVAEQTAERLMGMGLSDLEILDRAYNGDLNALINRNPSPHRASGYNESLPRQTAFNRALGQQENPYPGNRISGRETAPALSSPLSHCEIGASAPHTEAIHNRRNHEPPAALPAPSSGHGAAPAASSGHGKGLLSSGHCEDFSSSRHCEDFSSSRHCEERSDAAIHTSRKSKPEDTPSTSLIDEVIARFLDE